MTEITHIETAFCYFLFFFTKYVEQVQVAYLVEKKNDIRFSNGMSKDMQTLLKFNSKILKRNLQSADLDRSSPKNTKNKYKNYVKSSIQEQICNLQMMQWQRMKH